MKERKYKDDYRNELRLDPVTGREKVVPVYHGKYFETPVAEVIRRQGPFAMLSGFLFLGLMLAYYLIDFPGTKVLYVFIPSAFCLFPVFYWIIGGYACWKTPDRMTRLQKENGSGRVLRSSAGCAVFIVITLICDLIFLLFRHGPAREWIGFLILAAAGVTAFLTARAYRDLYNSIQEAPDKHFPI